MNKADLYYKENLNNIKNNGSKDENPRPRYKDGTPAHTLYITQVFEKYNLAEGEYPLTTLRNTAIKTGIKEILWIYQEQSNSLAIAETMGIRWWNEWDIGDGTIGKAYGYNIESHQPNELKKFVTKVSPKVFNSNLGEIKPITKRPILKSIDGKIYKAKYRNYGEYIIVDKIKKNVRTISRNYLVCQFLDYGYITEIREDSFKKGQHPKNNLTRTLDNVGYLDDFDKVNNFTELELKKLKNIWSNMIRRCYNNKNDNYVNIFVHHKWHSFKEFLLDVRLLPQYHLAKKSNFIGWELDKDYYGSNLYSKESCVFLLKKENILYRKQQIPPIKIIDDGTIYYELSYSSLAERLNLSKGYVTNLVKKGRYKNLKFEFITDDKYLYRYELSKNQINELLVGLKNKPFTRRHMTNFWNWGNNDKKGLVECAYSTHWSTRLKDGIMYLDLTLIQRSNDYIMAGYINKIQYVALQMMVAGHLNYKVGTFCHFVQNLHVYDRHINAMDEVLNNESLTDLPRIEISGNKNFYDYTIDDFKSINISKIPKLKSPLEIAI